MVYLYNYLTIFSFIQFTMASNPPGECCAREYPREGSPKGEFKDFHGCTFIPSTSYPGIITWTHILVVYSRDILLLPTKPERHLQEQDHSLLCRREWDQIEWYSKVRSKDPYWRLPPSRLLSIANSKSWNITVGLTYFSIIVGRINSLHRATLWLCQISIKARRCPQWTSAPMTLLSING